MSYVKGDYYLCVKRHGKVFVDDAKCQGSILQIRASSTGFAGIPALPAIPREEQLPALAIGEPARQPLVRLNGQIRNRLQNG